MDRVGKQFTKTGKAIAIAVKAGVANHVLRVRPEEVSDALSVIESTSRDALVELRHMLGLLRDPDEPVDLMPPAGLAALPELAAAYAYGSAKNHAFIDGNKRTAFMAMVVFLRKNGVRFAPDQAQATTMILALAAGEVSEESLARWIRDNWPKG